MRDGPHPEDTLFVYRGRSMWPTFQDGDVLVVRPYLGRPVRRGDCIVHRVEGQAAHIVHRVVATRPNILAQGDAHGVPDDRCIAPDAVVGLTVARVRGTSAARIWNGRCGLGVRSLLRILGRFDPERRSRGGVAARLVRRCLRPIVLRLGSAGPTNATRPHAAGDYVLWGRWVVARRTAPELEPELYWPWSLALAPEDVTPSA